MLSNLLFNRTALPDIEKSMDAYSLRQKVLSNNIANAMTPGYRAQKVSFEEEYRKSLYIGPDERLPMAQTNDKHLPLSKRPIKTFSQIQPEIGYRDNPLNDSGLNNVDIDMEMAEMAENQLRYEMATKLMNKRFANIKSSIRGR